MTTTSPSLIAPGRGAVRDSAHAGDIKGAFGTISLDDTGGRSSASARLKTLLAIVGPGLIVMFGDNDAGRLLDLRAGRPDRTGPSCCGRSCCSCPCCT